MNSLFLTNRGLNFIGEVMHAGRHWPLAHWNFPDFLLLSLVKVFPDIEKKEAINTVMDLGEGKFSRYGVGEALRSQIEVGNIEDTEGS